MAEVDGSITAGIGKSQNPAELVQGLTALQGTLLQNRLLGQQIAGKQAFGAAVLKNTRPDGTIDTGGVMTSLGPDAAMSAPEAAASMQALHIQQVAQKAAEANLTTAQIDAFQKNMEPVEGVIRGLVGSKEPLTKEAAAAALHRDIFEAGLVKTPEAAQMYGGLLSQLTDDPNHNRQVLSDVGLRLNGTNEGLALYKGTLKPTDTGPAIVTTQTPELGGATDVRMVQQKGLSPGEAASPVTVLDANGQAVAVPLGAMQGAPGAPAAQAGREGRYPGGAASAPAAGGVPGAYGVTSLAPGAADTMAASAKVFQDDIAAVPTVRKAITAFDQAATALAGAKTGKGSDVVQNLGAVADFVGLPIPESWRKNVESYAEADKWLSSAVAQEAGRLGLNTDASRDLQERAQPSTKTPQGAALAMLPVLKGLKAMDLAAPVIAQKQGISPQQYSAWRAQWANSVDPLAFSAPSMTPAERQKMGEKMTQAERSRYLAGVQAAIDAGVYSRADLAK